MSEDLQQRARRLEFFQAVRLLRKLAPERSGVGRSSEPDREVVRFRSDVSFAFPRSDVVRIDAPAKADAPPELTVAFLGIATPASFGSLPPPYAHAIFEQAREKSEVLRDFFDAFNHRLVSLYYRAFEKYNLGVAHETGDNDFFERALRGVLGLASGGLRERLRLSDTALFRRAGLLAMAPVPAIALRALIESAFGVAARIEQFVAAWYQLALEDQTRIGAANAQLGVDACVGARVRLAQYRFRVRLGPLDFEAYETLLPPGSAFEPLFDLIRFAVSPEQTFEVRLLLHAAEVPPLVLGGEPARRPLLGWSSWLTQEGRACDPEDARFASEVHATRTRQARNERAKNAWEEAA